MKITRTRAHLLLLVCLVLTALAYLPGLSGDYLFDDRNNLLENKALNMESLSVGSLYRAAFSTKSGELRRPVSMASFSLNRYFFGIEPYSYKLINLLIHLLTGIVLYILTRQIVRACQRPGAPPASATLLNWLPLVVTALWLAHPINLTSVLYIVQRMTSLSSLFMVAAMAMYMAGRLRMLSGRSGLGYIISGLLLFGTLSVFSKEIGVLLPLYILTLELVLFGFRDADNRIDRRIALFFGVFIIAPIAAGAIYLGLNFDTYTNYNGRDFTLVERLLTEPRVLVFYLQMLLAPTVQQLGLFHDDISISTGLLTPPATLYSILLLASLLAGAVLLMRRLPLLSLGILWFLAGHLLESTVLPLELAHEHRNYLPGFGILLALAGLVTALPVKRLSGVIHVAAPVLLLSIFVATTWLRSTQWSDNVNHSVYEARHHPNSPRAAFSAGRIHARLALNGHAESTDKAYAYLHRANRLDETGIMPAITLVKLDYLLERPVDTNLFDLIIDRLERHPLTASDINSIKDLTECQGEKCQVPAPVMERIFRTALDRPRPNARLLSIYGYYTINKQGNFDKGLELFEHVVERAPQEPQYWKNLINLLMVMARFDEAERRLEEFRVLNPYGSSEADFRALEEDLIRGRQEFAGNLNTRAEAISQ